MNIALSVLILVLLMLPGATLIRAYTSSLTQPKSNLHVSLNDMLFRGLGFSILIHCAGICILQFWFGREIKYNLLYELIAGKDIKDSDKNIGIFFRQFSFYVLLTVAMSWLFAKTARQLLLRTNFDFRIEGLSAQNYWYILFKGRYIENQGMDLKTIDFIFIDVLTDTGSIYSGILEDYNYNQQKDMLENIIISEVRRRELIKDPENEGRKKIGPPVAVPGDVFVIPAKNILNINVSYVQEIEDVVTEVEEYQ
ncbi:MAG TPA: DUF6338 family protein [Chitinophagaceae bacterium]|nr:DUF6338 family protein [Chitinophagaceae bacterium]